MIEVETIHEHVRIVKASGEIDYSNVSKFIEALRNAVRESPQGFVVDLSGVAYMDSSGMQAILGAYRSLWEAGGSMSLVITHPNVIELFSIVSAGSLPRFYICDSIDAAENALSGAGAG